MVDGYFDYRVVYGSAGVLVEADDDQFAYGPSIALVALGVHYLELPTTWQGKYLRLSNGEERTCLAGRVELDHATLAITAIDDVDRFFFLVCDDATVLPRAT